MCFILLRSLRGFELWVGPKILAVLVLEFFKLVGFCLAVSHVVLSVC